jgi:Polysaccharide lyase
VRRVLASAALTAVTLTTIGLIVGNAQDRTDSDPSATVSAIVRTPEPQPIRSRPPQRPSAEPETTRTPIPEPRVPAATPRGSRPSSQPNGVPVGSTVVFLADYETGDFSQWDTCQSVDLNSSCADVAGSRSMQVVEDPVGRHDRYAARFLVQPGDVPEFGGGERSEVSADDEENAATREGDERWYEWSMKLPADFRDPQGDWFIVMQWHSGDGSPPLAIDISRGTVDIGGDGSGESRQTIGPIRRGEWVSYVLHAKFSNDRETGFVEAWENGNRTVPKIHRATMSSNENFLKQGIYRDEGPGDGTAEVRFTGLRVTAP